MVIMGTIGFSKRVSSWSHPLKLESVSKFPLKRQRVVTDNFQGEVEAMSLLALWAPGSGR